MRRCLVVLALVACSSKDDASAPSSPSADGGAADAGTPDSSNGDGAASTSCIDRLVAPTVVDPATARELVVVNDPPAPMGIFDPSLVYPAGAGAGALSYSAVTAADDIETRIALSSDGGATWTYAVSANAAVDGGTFGKIIHEVSSLIVDPSEPDMQRRWKLFSHRYYAKGTELHYEMGHIALQTAPEAGGPWTTAAANIGWMSNNPFSSDGAVFVAQDSPVTSDCVALTEPSAIALPNAIALTVGCAAPTGIRVVLFLSTDHAATWTPIGTLAPATDAACLGRTPGLARVNAASLFAENGKVFVWLTPENPANGYHGCASVEVTDLVNLELARAADGAPIVTRLLTTPADQFSGACTSAEGATQSATLMSIAFLGDARPFRIFRP